MRNLFIVPLLLLLVSCTTAKPKPESFDNAEQAIAAAVAAGAEQHSPVELRFAREKLAEARKGVEFKQYDKTLYLIEQSEINAELAIEKSRAAVIRSEVTEMARQNEILREEFERTYGEEFK
jgi:hypothetical protein